MGGCFWPRLAFFSGRRWSGASIWLAGRHRSRRVGAAGENGKARADDFSELCPPIPPGLNGDVSDFIHLFSFNGVTIYGNMRGMKANHLPEDGPMPVTSRIGKVLRKRREALGLSQEDVARAGGLSTIGLHLIETGQRFPNMNTVERVATALQTLLAVVIVEASFEA